LEIIEPKSEAQTPPPSKPTEAPVVSANVDVLSQLSNIEDQLDSRVAAISRDVEFLRQLGAAMAEIKNQYRSLQTELAFAKDHAAQSSERAGRASELNRSLESQLQEEAAKVSELTKLLDQTRSEREAEKKHLSQQISANAAGRIDEFRNRLGLVLARLVVDLPQKEASVSAELGRVLLLQFHQFLEALRHEGIETRPRIAARP
jgi:chromosome segregation ATPase